MKMREIKNRKPKAISRWSWEINKPRILTKEEAKRIARQRREMLSEYGYVYRIIV